jgi:hypothetical protein
LAIPPAYEVITLMEKQCVQKIDWERFELDDENGKLITNSFKCIY